VIFPQDFVRKISEKSEFSNKFFHYLNVSAFSVPQIDAYHLNWEAD